MRNTPPPPAPRTDQRRAERQLVVDDLAVCEVVSQHSDRPVAVELFDLSASGAWLSTPMPLPTGAEVVVAMARPETSLTLFGRVRRICTGRRRGDRGPLGMAVEFVGVAYEERAEIEAWLAA
ncbi:MAG: PilZ domain-containing protein [Myxococcota bacterium]